MCQCQNRSLVRERYCAALPMIVFFMENRFIYFCCFFYKTLSFSIFLYTPWRGCFPEGTLRGVDFPVGTFRVGEEVTHDNIIKNHADIFHG